MLAKKRSTSRRVFIAVFAEREPDVRPPGRNVRATQGVAIPTIRAHIGLMYENHEGDFAYTIRRRTFRSGKTVWRWEVRRGIGNDFVDSGISLRSHDAAKTSALDAIFRWKSSQVPSRVYV
jgi:hypothetical protein